MRQSMRNSSNSGERERERERGRAGRDLFFFRDGPLVEGKERERERESGRFPSSATKGNAHAQHARGYTVGIGRSTEK